MKKTFEEFVKALKNEEVEDFGFKFTGSSCGVREYTKGNVVVAYYGGELCAIEIDGKSIGTEQISLFHFDTELFLTEEEKRNLFAEVN